VAEKVLAAEARPVMSTTKAVKVTAPSGNVVVTGTV
jgi:hypothetical protein